MAYMAAHSEGSLGKGNEGHSRREDSRHNGVTQDGHLHERGARHLGKTATDGTPERSKAFLFFRGLGHKYALAFFWQVKDSWVMAQRDQGQGHTWEVILGIMMIGESVLGHWDVLGRQDQHRRIMIGGTYHMYMGKVRDRDWEMTKRNKVKL